MDIRWQESRGILSRVSGFLRDAGFTHSLTPARNCTFGCTYCYVPTMRVQAGLKPEDWQRWGQFTTFKQNSAALAERAFRPNMVVYCSPLTDPYQPAEAEASMMPGIWRAVIARPPRVFVLQTRGPLVLRDLPLLQQAATRCKVRVSFSLTTDDDAIRRRFEPVCASIPERLAVMRTLRDSGVDIFATLAPLLPCDPDHLAGLAAAVTDNPFVGDPLHLRATKPRGATTRDAAFRILAHHGQSQWATPAAEADLIAKMKMAAARHGREFVNGPGGFALLAR